MFSMAARAKHDAWVAQAARFSDDTDGAKARYIEIAKELGWEGGKAGASGSGALGGVRVSTMAPPEDPDAGEASGSSRLHDAVIDGDEARVRRIIQEGEKVDVRDEYVRTLVDFLDAGPYNDADTVR